MCEYCEKSKEIRNDNNIKSFISKAHFGYSIIVQTNKLYLDVQNIGFINYCPMCRKEIRIKMCKFCDANSKGEILSGKPVRTYEWQKTAGYNPPEKRNDFLEMFILKNKDDKKAGLMVDSGYGYRYVDIDYCMFCGRRLGE